METLPDFWRTEVFHPLSVHFPIALFFIALLFKSMALFSKKETFSLGGSILLVLGVMGSWVAIYTGDLADGVVARTLCDPTILKDHENYAYTTAWIFTAAAILDFISYFFSLQLGSLVLWIKRLTLILLLIGNGFLMYVGHLGATLVYQQAAGVYVPTEDCQEFE
ncbi:DUF2231 domain-containing protein [Mesonia sp. MT50]|uniref:DUF2231 domain-containing protein n=1 Tax=Mesonia profundi TaxID=3070998 RepID=A0ABU0ZZS6_9FLAO|nr:DUF2231 domain-containing protein [Mesonia profundi]MDQ7916955.1 DUF2231 domain-containing protein [Mesonia profundi]